jgi:light-regulated signal transduction histidine kinase (bacteriophytochrome)
LDGQVRRHLERVIEATRRMGQIIDDLLSLAHLTRQELRREPVDLGAEALIIIQQLRTASPTGRTEDVEVADGLLAEGDRGLLRILLENLLGNAWKFTSKCEQPRIVFGRQLPTQGPTVFFVRDNGAGFDMQYAEKLFGVFQRLHSIREFPGNGVGLATVLRVVRRHGGKVWAESTVGQGATFFFTLDAA